MDLSFQGQRIYEQIAQIETERANLQVQERYYNYVINYFKANQEGSGLNLPSAMNVSDPIINQLISTMNDLNSQRSSLIAGKQSSKEHFSETD